MKRTVTSIVVVLTSLFVSQSIFAQDATPHQKKSVRLDDPMYHELKLAGKLNEYDILPSLSSPSRPAGKAGASHTSFSAPSPGLSPAAASQVITAGPDTSVCPGTQITLHADLLTGVPTQLTLNDDQWSDVINLPFPFTFYGNTYTQCLIGSNDDISFDIANANNYNTWPIGAPVPTAVPTDLVNAIMGPWQDIYPPGGGTIQYATIGTAPNRVFVVEYCNIPMFSCTSDLYSNQIQLKENGNIIETHILNKPLCTTWNGGNAIHAVQNAAGTIADVVAGRNYPVQWSTANEGYRLTPNGAGAYTITSIPFDPALLANPTVTWFANGVQIGTGATINVTPSASTNYIAQVISTCGNYVYSDTANITMGGGPIVSINAPIGCGNQLYNGGSVTLTASAVNAASYLWTPGGQTTASITVNEPGTYCVTAVSTSGCQSANTACTTVSNAAELVCGRNGRKVILCHVPPGNPGNAQTLCISPNAVAAHMAHHPGDCLGPCTPTSSQRLAEPIEVLDFLAEAYPNPFNSSFTVHVISSEETPIMVYIHDITGRIVETYSSVNEQTSIGNQLAPGLYSAEVVQGENRQVLHILKADH